MCCLQNLETHQFFSSFSAVKKNLVYRISFLNVCSQRLHVQSEGLFWAMSSSFSNCGSKTCIYVYIYILTQVYYFTNSGFIFNHHDGCSNTDTDMLKSKSLDLVSIIQPIWWLLAEEFILCFSSSVLLSSDLILNLFYANKYCLICATTKPTSTRFFFEWRFKFLILSLKRWRKKTQ